MKNGLFFEQNELIYYKDDRPYHAGVVKEDGKIYYIGRNGRAVKGQHIVHREMANGILERGTYTFGEDYVLVEGSFIKPRAHSKKRRKKRRGAALRIKRPVTAVIVAAVVVLVVSAAFLIDWAPVSKPHDPTSSTASDVVLPTFEGEVSLSSEIAAQLYRDELSIKEAVKFGDPYRALPFTYRLAQDGVLRISEHADFSDAREWDLDAGKTVLSIDNLKTATTYYYEVAVGKEVYTDTFKTASGTRYINWEGFYNTRDIGGYTTLDGKTVKQGMIIRGTELDGLADAVYFPSDETLQTALKDIGFVYDMDLRDSALFSGTYTSRFGANVKHRFYTAPAYGEIFYDRNKQAIKAVFSDLANPENYPLYMHCTHGADRTGTVVYLLQGVLNMPESVMEREYRMTAFLEDSFAENTALDVIRAGMQNYPGDTVQEKIQQYLITEIGVTPQELQSIRSILLED